MKILLLYNGDELSIPETGEWNQHFGHDGARLAWICAESWKRQGWAVERFHISRPISKADHDVVIPETHSFPEGTPLGDSPYRYNNFLPDLESYLLSCKGDNPGIWWVTTDVMNYEFSSANTGYMEFDHFIPTGQGTFTLAAGWITLRAVQQYNILLRVMNSYKKPLPEMPGMPCDEYWLRWIDTYRPAEFEDLRIVKQRIMGSPMDGSHWPLVHYSRSCLQWLPKERF